MPDISAVNALRRRATQRAQRHPGAGMGRHDDRVTVLRDAVDDQAGGNERQNPKIN
jgi:hypothetical protein